MSRRDKPSAPHDIASLYPKGTVQFIAAVMCMTLALAMLGFSGKSVLFADADVSTSIKVQMISVVVLTFLIVHPTFMLARGKNWPRKFLRCLNAVCIAGLVLSIAWLAFQQSTRAYASLVGLAFALAAFKLYRSEGFRNACAFYETIWTAHRERQHMARTTRAPKRRKNQQH